MLWCLLCLWKPKVYTYIPSFYVFIHNQLRDKNYTNAFRWHKCELFCNLEPLHILVLHRSWCCPGITAAQSIFIHWPQPAAVSHYATDPQPYFHRIVSNTTTMLTRTLISTGVSQTLPQYWPVLLFPQYWTILPLPQDCLKYHHNTDLYSYFQNTELYSHCHRIVSNTTILTCTPISTILNYTPIATGLSQIPPQYWPVLLFPQDCLKYHHNTYLYSYFHRIVSNTTTMLTRTPISTGVSQTLPQYWPVLLFPQYWTILPLSQDGLKYHHNTDLYSYFHRTVSNTITILTCTPISTGLSQTPPQYSPSLLFPQDSLKHHHNTEPYSISTGLSQTTPQYWTILLFPQDCLKHHWCTELQTETAVYRANLFILTLNWTYTAKLSVVKEKLH